MTKLTENQQYKRNLVRTKILIDLSKTLENLIMDNLLYEPRYTGTTEYKQLSELREKCIKEANSILEKQIGNLDI